MAAFVSTACQGHGERPCVACQINVATCQYKWSSDHVQTVSSKIRVKEPTKESAKRRAKVSAATGPYCTNACGSLADRKQPNGDKAFTVLADVTDPSWLLPANSTRSNVDRQVCYAIGKTRRYVSSWILGAKFLLRNKTYENVVKLIRFLVLRERYRRAQVQRASRYDARRYRHDASACAE